MTYVLTLIIATTGNKVTWPQYDEKKANDLDAHFQTLGTLSRSLEGTKSAAALSHCSTVVKAPKSPSQGGVLFD